MKYVSIHAPREGCDTTGKTQELLNSVSIHAPREGCDSWKTLANQAAKLFQFTHPGRGATTNSNDNNNNVAVSIHAPREGCDLKFERGDYFQPVSIHAPREGCDGYPAYFLGGLRSVSIHAPREGCDDLTGRTTLAPLVSIHAPREGCDPEFIAAIAVTSEFQFTHPGRGATSDTLEEMALTGMFQFTHPGRGATPPQVPTNGHATRFNSRTPGGVRHEARNEHTSRQGVSIHAPREGCDAVVTTSEISI